MPMTDQQLRTFVGSEVIDKRGDKAGKVQSVYIDTETQEPVFLAVKTGLFGHRSTLVPLAGARKEDAHLRVAYDKDTVKAAPTLEEEGPISNRDVAQIYQHYGLRDTRRTGNGGTGSTGTANGRTGASGSTGTGSAAGAGSAAGVAGAGSAAAGTGATGRVGSSGRNGGAADRAMSRSEEELHIGVEREESGRARLIKWVETEPVTETVEVAHEEVRVVREPISDDNIDAAMSGPDLRENVHEVVLHEERPVVEKRTVPKERVRMETERVTETQEITEDLRKERIKVDGDAKAGRRR